MVNSARRWEGKTVACIASGPSLTKDDCDAIQRAGIPTIAVNNSWQMAPFAQIIYAGDAAWWANHFKSITCKSELWSCSRTAVDRYKINFHYGYGAFNSGSRAIELALEFGAAKVILLGYDCTVKHGVHWHPNHTATSNPNAAKCASWRKQFARISTKRAAVINCSRVTALDCFPKKPLEEMLC